MKRIRLGRLRENNLEDSVAVDDEDFDWLSSWHWSKLRAPHTCYARRTVNGTTLTMHRLIVERMLGRPIAPGMEVDHADGNGLNNRRSNLSEVTHRKNLLNRHARKPWVPMWYI